MYFLNTNNDDVMIPLWYDTGELGKVFSFRSGRMQYSDREGAELCFMDELEICRCVSVHGALVWRFPHPIPSKINLSNLFWLKSDTSKTCPTSRKQVFWRFFLLENIKKQIGGYFSNCLDNHPRTENFQFRWYTTLFKFKTDIAPL